MLTFTVNFFALAILGTQKLINAAEPVDNGVYGEPEIQCTSDSVRINFKTYNVFEGHLYVKGHYDQPGCRIDATNDRAASIQIPFTSCDVRRERSTNPVGLLISTIVVLSFHPMFVTKVDKAYHVKCFYLAADKPVTAGLDVSMFTTQLVTFNSPLPICRYEVLEGGHAGTPLKYAMVGQEVYHKWSCESEIKDIYCMTIHSCFVDDDNNKKTQLLDENGCAQDKYLMNNIFYDDDLQGGISNLVFKYADKPTVFFQCQIRLTYKEDSYNKCQRTSDTCPWPTRGKRSPNENSSFVFAQNNLHKKQSGAYKSNQLVASNFDVFSEQMTVLDVEDENLEIDNQKLKRALEQNDVFNGEKGRSKSGTICFSPASLGLLSSVMAVLFLACLSATVYFWVRKTGGKPSFLKF